MPVGPYKDFNECVLKNADKSSPQGFCAWLEHKVTGKWPGEMTSEFPEPFMKAYDAALVAKKSEAEAFKEAEIAARAAGFEKSHFGWLKSYQSPKMKTVSGVDVFAAGEWTDSAGITRKWTTSDLDKMVAAFEAGTPLIVNLKCGHTSDEFNSKIAEALGVPVEVVTGDNGHGQIKIGNMTSLERRGDLLIATFDNVPEQIASLIEGGMYSTVSVEIEDEVGDFGPVITGVALLGAEEPAVDKATLEKALVFGGARNGARVWSFKVGDQLPDAATLRSEFEDIRSKIADVVKGKKGAPIFRALFSNIAELFEHMTGDKKSGQEDKNKQEDEPSMKLPKVLESMKSADIRKLSISDLVKKFQGGETPKVDDLQSVFAEDLTAVASALGLPPECSIEDMVAAINALKQAVAQGGDMSKQFSKANEEIEKLKTSESIRNWEDKTREFTAIPGTAHEHAVRLADIEKKAGKEYAESQFAALKNANDLSVNALKTLGTDKKGKPSSFDAEVSNYMKANPTVQKADAIKYVSHAHPELWESRNG